MDRPMNFPTGKTQRPEPVRNNTGYKIPKYSKSNGPSVNRGSAATKAQTPYRGTGKA